MKAQLLEIENSLSQGTKKEGTWRSSNKFRKPITKFRVIGGMSRLTNDKSGFRDWKTKTKYALAQIFETNEIKAIPDWVEEPTGKWTGSETMDETKEVLLTVGSYPDDPYVQHLVLGLMFIRYDSYTTGVSDEKQMAALGKIIESEPNAARRILYWGPLVIIYHTFSVTVTRFAGRAASRLILSLMPKSGGDGSCP